LAVERLAPVRSLPQLQASPAPPPPKGLSHYLEHMLFMGSEAFPDENEYDAFLTKHGGSSNAYTELVGGVISGGCKAWQVAGSREVE
jgi:hypothetical protein